MIIQDIFVEIRNVFFHTGYRFILKPIFFRIDPEWVHDNAVFTGRILGSNPLTRFLTRCAFGYQNPILEQRIHGITFKNPIGLAAGFDKNAELTQTIPCVGFGFEEVGSITAKPCEGNPKPRLWRLPEKKALRVYYGLKNDGAEIIAKRLKKRAHRIPIGTSIAKTNDPSTCQTAQGIADYVQGFEAFTHIGAYFTINISCPNAFGGQPFTDPKQLSALLTELDKISTQKPIFLKLSPDLSESELDAILDLCKKHRISGFICSNLTKKHSYGEGGLSGKAVESLANRQLEYVYKKTGGKSTLIACGGVFSAKDAYTKIKSGASLVQLVTGMIFEGPQMVSEINRGLTKLLRADGYQSISEAVGKNLT